MVPVTFLWLLGTLLCISAEEKQYDYIVVGAGTAGSIVATRLQTSGTVLVVEAGDEPPEGQEKMKGFQQSLVGDSKYDWLLQTTPQLTGKPITIHTGKVLGGTGTINSMIFVRGNKKDYDSWVDKYGAVGWGWDDNIDIMRGIEHSYLTGVQEELHGTSGPIAITNVGQEIPIVKNFVDAVMELGYNNVDPSDGKQTGAAITPVNYWNNERQSTYRKYLKPYVEHSSNKITLLKNSLVQKIDFEQENGEYKAVGITYVDENGETQKAKANREVILCAGTFGSAKLLMLSGIGPREHLEEMKISVISARPVGENLQDHYGVFAPVLGSSSIFDGVDSALAYVNTAGAEAGSQPDIEIEMFQFANYSITATCLLRPESKGTVKLSSNNPNDSPIIDPQYLSTDNDLNTIAKGLKIMDEVVEKWDVESAGYFKIPDPYDALKQVCTQETKSHEYWKCIAKYMGGSSYHPVGTCRMGAKTDDKAVVDENLNVIGVKGLRVADASIMPTITSANPQVTVMFIAERASLLIHNDYGSQ